MNKRGQVYLLAALILIVALFGLVSTYNLVEQPSTGEDFEEISENYDTEAAKVFNSLIGDSNADMFSGLINFNKLFTSYAKSKDPDFGVIYAVDYEVGEEDGYVDDDKDPITPEVRVSKTSGGQVQTGDKIVQIGNYLEEEVIVFYGDSIGGTYTQVYGCYSEISAVIAFGNVPIRSDVSCESIGGGNVLDFCSCNVLLPYDSTKELWLRISGYWYPFQIIPNKPQIMVISKEEAQDQVQVYVEEIIKEDPGEKEGKFNKKCEDLGLSGLCDSVDYCEDIDVKCGTSGLGCKPKCGLFKRNRCEESSYCGWSIDNVCECSGAVGKGVGESCDPNLGGADCKNGICEPIEDPMTGEIIGGKCL